MFMPEYIPEQPPQYRVPVRQGATEPITILLVHNYYQLRGGEDGVFENEARLLESKGHRVIRYVAHNKEIPGMSRTKLALGTIWNREGARQIRTLLKWSGADVIHFHNTFPLISPAAYYAASAAGVPVIQTLHNYRLICAGATLLRNGTPCQDCVGKRLPWPAIRHACYQGSRTRTAAVALMQGTHGMLGTWTKKVSRFIALSHSSKSLFVNAGLPQNRIVVKPNFIRVVGEDGRGGSANGVGAVFVGRLSPEKGVGTLVEAWASIDAPLRIIGDGPLLQPLKAAAGNRVTFRGSLKHDAVFTELRNSAFVVMPSIWHESFGLAAVEAFSVARPVIASRMGSLEEIVEDGVTGLLFSPGEKADLETKIRWALAHPDEMRLMGQRARKVYEEKYSSEANYRQLIEAYDIGRNVPRPK